MTSLGVDELSFDILTKEVIFPYTEIGSGNMARITWLPRLIGLFRFVCEDMTITPDNAEQRISLDIMVVICQASCSDQNTWVKYDLVAFCCCIRSEIINRKLFIVLYLQNKVFPIIRTILNSETTCYNSGMSLLHSNIRRRILWCMLWAKFNIYDEKYRVSMKPIHCIEIANNCVKWQRSG